MKKSEMNDIQKANYEYMRSLGIKKSWAKRLITGGYDSEPVGTVDIPTIVLGFNHWDETEEGFHFWSTVDDNTTELLTTISYSKALFKIPNNITRMHNDCQHRQSPT
jgi:hypothetical protein